MSISNNMLTQKWVGILIWNIKWKHFSRCAVLTVLCSLPVHQDQVEKVHQKQLSMQDMFDKRRVSLKKLAAKQTRPVQPVAPRPEAFIKSPLSSPGQSPHIHAAFLHKMQSLFRHYFCTTLMIVPIFVVLYVTYSVLHFLPPLNTWLSGLVST